MRKDGISKANRPGFAACYETVQNHLNDYKNSKSLILKMVALKAILPRIKLCS
ncbi:hypothetical protein [Candidatus Bealeia paramacronuclearis]|uniref:hypothetical protein n=1 Tax=Candidatus Bealeia paramacronuclearis TaxID=1921001 RepID=UPI0030D19810